MSDSYCDSICLQSCMSVKVGERTSLLRKALQEKHQPLEPNHSCRVTKDLLLLLTTKLVGMQRRKPLQICRLDFASHLSSKTSRSKHFLNFMRTSTVPDQCSNRGKRTRELWHKGGPRRSAAKEHGMLRAVHDTASLARCKSQILHRIFRILRQGLLTVVVHFIHRRP